MKRKGAAADCHVSQLTDSDAAAPPVLKKAAPKSSHHVSQLSDSDGAARGGVSEAPVPALKKGTKSSAGSADFIAVQIGDKAAVQSKSSNSVLKGTEVDNLKTAELLAREMNKGRSVDDLKYLIFLMESVQQAHH